MVDGGWESAAGWSDDVTAGVIHQFRIATGILLIKGGIDMTTVPQARWAEVPQPGPAARDMSGEDLRPERMPYLGYCLQVSRPIGPHGLVDRKPGPLDRAEE